MTGRVIYLDWITRSRVQSEPEAVFVFGDNAERVGMGGQAGAMRGEPNAIGVATKWSPSASPEAFFSDDDPLCVAVVDEDIGRVEDALRGGRTVYLPRDGLGTGLSELPVRAPSLLQHINARFRAMPGEPCPWRP
jgi:hypothetical protein